MAVGVRRGRIISIVHFLNSTFNLSFHREHTGKSLLLSALLHYVRCAHVPHYCFEEQILVSRGAKARLLAFLAGQMREPLDYLLGLD